MNSRWDSNANEILTSCWLTIYSHFFFLYEKLDGFFSFYLSALRLKLTQHFVTCLQYIEECKLYIKKKKTWNLNNSFELQFERIHSHFLIFAAKKPCNQQFYFYQCFDSKITSNFSYLDVRFHPKNRKIKILLVYERNAHFSWYIYVSRMM